VVPWVVLAVAAGVKFWRLTSLFRKHLLGIPSRTERFRQALERIWVAVTPHEIAPSTGIDLNQEGITSRLLVFLRLGLQCPEIAVGERHLTNTPTPKIYPNTIERIPQQIPQPTFSTIQVLDRFTWTTHHAKP
jgi:hypothetical protein